MKDREALLTFYDFPATHWQHIRTTNPIESTFATVQVTHRQDAGMCQPQYDTDHGIQAGFECGKKAGEN